MQKGVTGQLKNYYFRKGNRILFSNGMTLNQLALCMWEKLGYREIDSSVLSKVINGNRHFSPKQLEVFADNLPVNLYFYFLCHEYFVFDLETRNFALCQNLPSLFLLDF